MVLICHDAEFFLNTLHHHNLRWVCTFGMILIQLVGGLLPVLNLVLERSDQTLHQSTVGEI